MTTYSQTGRVSSWDNLRRKSERKKGEFSLLLAPDSQMLVTMALRCSSELADEPEISRKDSNMLAALWMSKRPSVR
jgi:hypothetical protein